MDSPKKCSFLFSLIFSCLFFSLASASEIEPFKPHVDTELSLPHYLFELLPEPRDYEAHKQISPKLPRTGSPRVTREKVSSTRDLPRKTKRLPSHGRTIDNALSQAPIGCSGCRRKFFTKADLIQHRKEVAAKNFFVCSQKPCQKHFAFSHQLENHLRSHQTEQVQQLPLVAFSPQPAPPDEEVSESEETMQTEDTEDEVVELEQDEEDTDSYTTLSNSPASPVPYPAPFNSLEAAPAPQQAQSSFLEELEKLANAL